MVLSTLRSLALPSFVLSVSPHRRVQTPSLLPLWRGSVLGPLLLLLLWPGMFSFWIFLWLPLSSRFLLQHHTIKRPSCVE